MRNETVAFGSQFVSVFPLTDMLNGHVTDTAANIHVALSRRARYCIIYVWKIIEGLVPKFSKQIVCSYSERM